MELQQMTIMMRVVLEDRLRGYKTQGIRPVARLIERGVHVKNVLASGHTTYNLISFMLINTCIILG